MGRKSKLTEAQRSDAQRRRIAGEPWRSIASGLNISVSALRENISGDCAEIEKVANKLLDAERALTNLPIAQQITAQSLVDELRAVSMHMASAAKYSAATAHRLSGIAHANVQKIDDSMPLDEGGIESLRGVATLTKMANDASSIPLGLMNANRDRMNSLADNQPKPMNLNVKKLTLGVMKELLAAREH